MGMAEIVDGPAGGEVEISLAGFVPDACAYAPDQHNGLPPNGNAYTVSEIWFDACITDMRHGRSASCATSLMKYRGLQRRSIVGGEKRRERCKA